MGIRLLVVLIVVGALAVTAATALATDGATGGTAPPSGKSEPSSKKKIKLPKKLKQIAQCESGGNPRAISPSGQYRGKYQFSRETWRSLGGKGDPAKASERKQDRLAARLYAMAGTTPWPNCA